VPTSKEILQRALELKKILAALGAPFSGLRSKVARVEASAERLRIPPESDENRFEGIAIDDECWF
jgi:hypothetical protein